MTGKRGATEEILKYLKKHKTITSMEAFEMFGVTRLASIIFNLRKEYDIDTLMVETTTRYGETCQYAKYRYRGEL